MPTIFRFSSTRSSEDVAERPGVVARLVKRVTDFLGRKSTPELSVAPAQVVEAVTTESGTADVGYSSLASVYWQNRTSRRAEWIDLRDMDLNDPLISTALDVHADCVTGYQDTDVDAFEWQLEVTNDKAMAVLDDMKRRLQLGTECWQIVRSFVRNGEEFREVVVDDKMLIRRFKHLPSFTLTPRFDAMGNQAPGWEQRPEGAAYKLIEFEDWQIVAFVYGARRGWFGTGLMVPARRTWKRLQKVEDGMAIARMIRAYDKLQHRIPVGASWSPKQMQQAIFEYKQNMTRRKGLDGDGNLFSKERQNDVETDFFIPDDGTNRGGITVLSGQNQQLQNIDDVKHHQELLLARLKVPRKYLNLGSGTSGALTDGGLSAEDIQFARQLRQEQAVLRGGLHRLGELQLIFAGFVPDQLGLGVQMAEISTQDMLQDAKVLLTNAQAARFFAEVLGSLPPELVADKFMILSEDEKETLIDFLAEEEAEAEERAATLPPMPPPVEGEGVNPDDVIQTVTRLQMMVQGELERRGVRFGIGQAERTRRNRAALAEVLAE